MQNLADKYKGLRVLLRRQLGQVYLQPNGEWGQSRETARRFEGTVAAYYWALERKLLGVEVLMAFDDEQWDVVTIRV